MLSSLYGMIAGSTAPQSKTDAHIEDEDPIISDSDVPQSAVKTRSNGLENRKKPARAIKNVNKARISAEKTRWEVTKPERERMKKIKSLNKELRLAMETDSERMRTDRKRQREERIKKEKESMSVEKIKLSRTMKKLAPRHRHKLGVYAQHELTKMIEQRARR